MSAIVSRRSGLIIAIVAVISSIHALYFIRGAWADRNATQEKTARLEKELLRDQHKLINHDVFAEQLSVMRPMLTQLKKQLPTHLDPAAIETTLREEAARSKVQLENLHEAAEVLKEGFYAEKNITFQVQGSTENFFAFMDQVLRASPLRYVHEMKIEPLDGSTIQAHMIMTYIHPIEFE